MLIFIRQSAKHAAKMKTSQNGKFFKVTYMLPFLSNLGFLVNLSKFVDSPSNLLSKVTQSASNNAI